MTDRELKLWFEASFVLDNTKKRFSEYIDFSDRITTEQENTQ